MDSRPEMTTPQLLALWLYYTIQVLFFHPFIHAYQLNHPVKHRHLINRRFIANYSAISQKVSYQHETTKPPPLQVTLPTHSLDLNLRVIFSEILLDNSFVLFDARIGLFVQIELNIKKAYFLAFVAKRVFLIWTYNAHNIGHSFDHLISDETCQLSFIK